MKTLSIKSLAVCAFAILTLVSCSKKKDDVPAPPPADPIVGKWVGTYRPNALALNIYYAFNIKPAGVLEIVNVANKVLGTGTWKIKDGVFYGVYEFSDNKEKYNMAAKYDEEGGELNGSYGDGDKDPSDGSFKLHKI